MALALWGLKDVGRIIICNERKTTTHWIHYFLTFHCIIPSGRILFQSKIYTKDLKLDIYLFASRPKLIISMPDRPDVFVPQSPKHFWGTCTCGGWCQGESSLWNPFIQRFFIIWIQICGPLQPLCWTSGGEDQIGDTIRRKIDICSKGLAPGSFNNVVKTFFFWRKTRNKNKYLGFFHTLSHTYVCTTEEYIFRRVYFLYCHVFGVILGRVLLVFLLVSTWEYT